MESVRIKSVGNPDNGGYPSKVIHRRLHLALPKSIPSILLWAIFSHIDLNSPDCKSGNSRIGPFQSETQYLAVEFQPIVERKQSGNAVITLLPHSIRLVSASDRFEKIGGDRAETLLLHCRLYQITYLQ
jgi:hypothetical protein